MMEYFNPVHQNDRHQDVQYRTKYNKMPFSLTLSLSSPTHQESWGVTQLHYKVLCWQYVLYILIWFKTWSNYRELLDEVRRHTFLLYTSTAKMTENQISALKLQQLFCHTKVTFPKLPSVTLMRWCSLEGLSDFLPIGGVTWHGQQQTLRIPDRNQGIETDLDGHKEWPHLMNETMSAVGVRLG